MGTRKGARVLTCYWQAVLGLRWFREDREVEDLARNHGISRATGYRYLAEVIKVLAAQAPGLDLRTDGAELERFKANR